MNYSLNKTMREAMRLMHSGDLHAATAAIQRGLTGGGRPVRFSSTVRRPGAGKAVDRCGVPPRAGTFGS